MRRWLTLLGSLAFLSVVIALSIWWGGHARAQSERATWGAKQGERCIQCHGSQNFALVEEWRLGAHGQKGVNCFD